MATRKKIEEENNKGMTKADQNDALAMDVLSVINKKFKDYPEAAGYLSNANLITTWCSTGCDILDLAIANRPNGGLGFGSICEISGLEDLENHSWQLTSCQNVRNSAELQFCMIPKKPSECLIFTGQLD